MSETGNSFQAELLLQESNRRTRLLKIVRGETAWLFPWVGVLSVFFCLGILAYWWFMPEPSMDDILFFCLLYFVAVMTENRNNGRLVKRFEALVKVLEQDGVLRDMPHVRPD